MLFSALKANVQSAMGRDDVPTYVYDLMTADVNSELNVVEMQAETTLTASGESVTLPIDFGRVESLYIDSGGTRTPLEPTTERAQAWRHDPQGRPYYYAIHNGELTLMPVPDGEYTLTLRYFKELAAFVGDTDTNDAIARYPSVFFYSALTHAAVWDQDTEKASTYNSAYVAALGKANKGDLKKRHSGGTIQRRAKF